MSLQKWAAEAAKNIMGIREFSPGNPDDEEVSGVEEIPYVESEGAISDEDWFESPGDYDEPSEPKGIPENGANTKRTDSDNPTGLSFNKLNGSGVTGSGSGAQVAPRNGYYGG